MAIYTLIVKPYMYDAEKPTNASNITQSQEESEDDDEDAEYNMKDVLKIKGIHHIPIRSFQPESFINYLTLTLGIFH
jgi:hypothetical protein